MLRSMEVGQTITFPIAKTISVRTAASELGLTHQRIYKTFTDRSAALVCVTRIE